ncbi:nitroreductase family protein [Streptosporangium roseum]|uniref:nitroreductase family protein n=1 Tax=Streptosporangium roseum TaxID=2001 RepID=UPI003324DC0C
MRQIVEWSAGEDGIDTWAGELWWVVTMDQDLRLDLHPLLADRFSPFQFDPAGVIDDEKLGLLLEAARWAPSAGNSQPWGFLPVRPGEPGHARVTRYLAQSSARWAPNAGLLIVNLTRRYVDDTDLVYSEFADYDLGQAVAYLTVQAQAMGLTCHQFRAFDIEGLTAELRPNPGWVVMSMTAVGVAADRGQQARWRRSVAELRSDPWSEDRRP